jgi:hypothetical protein
VSSTSLVLELTLSVHRRCLCFVQLPKNTEARTVESLFRTEPGFVGFRTVRHMCFVDFENERQSTAAMRKYQGYTFGGATNVSALPPHPLVWRSLSRSHTPAPTPSLAPPPTVCSSSFAGYGDARDVTISRGVVDQGLAIDFDKDHVSKRNRSYEIELQSRKSIDDSDKILRYYCSKCHTRCVVLDKVWQRVAPCAVGWCSAVACRAVLLACTVLLSLTHPLAALAHTALSPTLTLGVHLARRGSRAHTVDCAACAAHS